VACGAKPCINMARTAAPKAVPSSGQGFVNGSRGRNGGGMKSRDMATPSRRNKPWKSEYQLRRKALDGGRASQSVPTLQDNRSDCTSYELCKKFPLVNNSDRHAESGTLES